MAHCAPAAWPSSGSSGEWWDLWFAHMWYSCLLRPHIPPYIAMCAHTAPTGQTQGKPEIRGHIATEGCEGTDKCTNPLLRIVVCVSQRMCLKDCVLRILSAPQLAHFGAPLALISVPPSHLTSITGSDLTYTFDSRTKPSPLSAQVGYAEV